MEDPIENRLNELRDIAKRYSKAEAQRSYLEEFKKSKLSMLMKDAEKQGVSSVSAQERDGRMHRDYLVLLEGLREATEEAEHLHWQLKIAMTGAELWRTRESTRRAERKGYGA